MNRLLDAIDKFIYYTIKRNPREYECCDDCLYNTDCMCCTGCPNFIMQSEPLDNLDSIEEDSD